MTRVNLWTVLAEWTTALVALALLSFYFFALGSATTADRGESSYMLLSAPYPPHVSLPVASRPVRVLSILVQQNQPSQSAPGVRTRLTFS